MQKIYRLFFWIIFMAWAHISGAASKEITTPLEKKPFHFENYKNDDEIETALYAAHPKGSNIENLHITLLKAGAEFRENKNLEQQNDPDNKTLRLYRYHTPQMGWDTYGIMVRHSLDQAIEEINVYKSYQGL